MLTDNLCTLVHQKYIEPWIGRSCKISPNKKTDIPPKSWSGFCIISRSHRFGPFLPFYPIIGPKNEKKFPEMKKGLEIIILHKCIKNHHYSTCSFSDTVQTSIFSFWAIFCTFTPFLAQKIKISEKWKTHTKILLFSISVPETTITDV